MTPLYAFEQLTVLLPQSGFVQQAFTPILFYRMSVIAWVSTVDINHSGFGASLAARCGTTTCQVYNFAQSEPKRRAKFPGVVSGYAAIRKIDATRIGRATRLDDNCCIIPVMKLLTWEKGFFAELTTLGLVWQRLAGIAALVLVLAVPARAQQSDFDSYKVRLSGFWAYSNPSGSLEGSADTGTINLQQDLGFNSYSTFVGKFDWKFTRKNHLYFVATPFNSSRQIVLDRTIDFQGQTFVGGATIQSSLKSNLYAPGYQYDIIRRKRGHLGIAVQVDLFDASAKISAAAQNINGGQSQTASGSLLAPIPVAGPEFRLYLTNSPKLFVEGNVYGMYFGGYGNFVSTADTVGWTLTKHLSINAGYQVGSRLVVTNNASSDRIGLRLTQKGALAGVEFSF
jgi:hypothetical protein